MKLDGSVDGFRQGTHGAREFAEIAVSIAGWNGLHGGSQGRLIFDRLRHESQLRPECRYLGARRALSESTLMAASLASARRVPARMLKELSTTINTSRLLARAVALRLKNGLAKARIKSTSHSRRSESSRNS